MRILKTLGLVALASGLWTAAPASAQPLGVYRWQVAPYCNVINVAVVQQGVQYQLDGTDDQCGAAQAASVRGMAFLNPNGTIGFGLTIVTAPGGIPVHVDATITLPGLNGTWRDSGGNTGNLIFSAGVAHVGPRPVPSGGLAPHSVTTIQIAPAAVTNAQIATDAVGSTNVVDGSITNGDLASPPQLQFQTLTFLSLTPTLTTVRSIALTAPAAGKVMVTVSGNFQLVDPSDADFAQCSLGATAGFDDTHRVQVGKPTFSGEMHVPFSSTRVFSVPAGSFTALFNCRELSGDVAVYDVAATALFIGS